jgi:hypothetical protein
MRYTDDRDDDTLRPYLPIRVVVVLPRGGRNALADQPGSR